MRLALALALLATSSAGLASQAGDKKPFEEPGAREEWQEDQPLRPGDKWIRVRMYVDKAGKPTKCRTIKSNIRSDSLRFQVCQAMMRDWHIEPVIENGVAVETSVERMMIMPGPATRAAEEAARKRAKAQRR
ncbi:MAG TPA: hypothetical protein VF589_09675 [Allosphingosinicella sp.]|jgi:hypothetical protein